MSKCFLITGGGTGAKLAEAFVHLCASGGGPDEVHLLLIDADTDNGNFHRTTDTIALYQKLRPWGWKLNTGGNGIEFFRTDLRSYILNEGVKTVLGGTLRDGAGTDEALQETLDLLFDEEEQTSENQFGFLARANLGSLILAEHLEIQLARKNSQAEQFVKALGSALKSDDAVQIMVAGSIFGGTGASLLPVARTCVLNVLGLKRDDPGLEKLHFAAVMMMPYFAPSKKVQPSVDPERFLLDTSLALQYYGRTQLDATESYERIYLVGSDKPGRASNQLHNPVSGGKRQNNPAFLEEWIGAQAVQHFAVHGKDRPSKDNRVYVYHWKQGAIGWENLPWPEPARRAEAIERMACLLHLAAFYLKPQRKTSGTLSGGLHTTLANLSGGQLEHFGWFDELLHQWGKNMCVEYANVLLHSPDERWETLRDRAGNRSFTHLHADLGEYFTRLLCWASSALNSDDIKLVDAPLASEDHEDYARLYSAMCDVHDAILQQNGPVNDYRNDNALARLVRAAAAALVMDRKSHPYSAKPGGNPLTLRRKSGSTDGPMIPWIRKEEIEEKANQLQRGHAFDSYFGQTAR